MRYDLLRRATSEGHSPVFVIRLAANWNRSSFYSGTFLCRRQNATWAANNDFATQ